MIIVNPSGNIGPNSLKFSDQKLYMSCIYILIVGKVIALVEWLKQTTTTREPVFESRKILIFLNPIFDGCHGS